MNTIKIPDGWYELKLAFGERLRETDMHTSDGMEGWRPMWDCWGKSVLVGHRYIRRMDYNQLQAERSRLDPKYRPDYRNPPAASGTPSTGILAAAQDIEDCYFPGRRNPHRIEVIEAFIAKYCVGRDVFESSCSDSRSHSSKACKEYQRAETEKSRADNLQVELNIVETRLKDLKSTLLDIIRFEP